MKVTIIQEAEEQFQSLPATIQNRVRNVFLRLANWPNVSGAKPLSGPLAGKHRIRTGDYRVQFYLMKAEQATQPTGTAAEPTIVVEKVGHRDGFYDEQR